MTSSCTDLCPDFNWGSQYHTLTPIMALKQLAMFAFVGIKNCKKSFLLVMNSACSHCLRTKNDSLLNMECIYLFASC